MSGPSPGANNKLVLRILHAVGIGLLLTLAINYVLGPLFTMWNLEYLIPAFLLEEYYWLVSGSLGLMLRVATLIVPCLVAIFMARIPFEAAQPIRRNANAVGIGLLLMLFCGYILLPLPLLGLRYFIPAGVYEEYYGVIDGTLELLVYVGMFLIPTLVVMAIVRIPPKVAFPMRKARPSLVIPAVFLALGASYIGMMISAGLTDWFTANAGVRPTMPDFAPPRGMGAIVIHCISIAIAPAIVEELLFRGVVMQSLRRFGDGFALVISTILFSLGHGNLLQLPTSFLAGLVIGYFVLRTGSLATGMIIHCVNNSLAVAMELIDMYGGESLNNAADMVLACMYLILPLLALVVLLKRNRNMFRLMPSSYPLQNSEKVVSFFTTVSQIIFFTIMVEVTKMYFERAY